MSFIIGIDEAGIGPVIGPLVVSGVFISSDTLQALTLLGVQDSKIFGSTVKSRAVRQRIVHEATPFILKTHTELILADQLDHHNMYDLEFEAIAKILQQLSWEKAQTIYIAQLGQARFQTMISALAQTDLCFSTHAFIQKVIYEIDADAKFIPVSMASLIAKTTRDQEMEQLCHSIQEPYISGYPNQNTATFLQRYYAKTGELPPQTRKSRKWEPLKALARLRLRNKSKD